MTSKYLIKKIEPNKPGKLVIINVSGTRALPIKVSPKMLFVWIVIKARLEHIFDLVTKTKKKTTEEPINKIKNHLIGDTRKTMPQTQACTQISHAADMHTHIKLGCIRLIAWQIDALLASFMENLFSFLFCFWKICRLNGNIIKKHQHAAAANHTNKYWKAYRKWNYARTKDIFPSIISIVFCCCCCCVWAYVAFVYSPYNITKVLVSTRMATNHEHGFNETKSTER